MSRRYRNYRKRHKRNFLRYSPYFAVIGVAGSIVIHSFGGQIIENLQYERLQALFTNKESESTIIEEDNITVVLPNVALDVIDEVNETLNSEIEPVVAEEIIDEVQEEETIELPFISDELLASGYDFQNISFDELLEINNEVCGWITIDGTNIDYPVMYAPNREDNYYLHHDIYGNDSSSGTLYIYSESNSLNNSQEGISDVTLMFGHNLISGKMFTQLVKYYKQSFYDEHQFGVIYTPDGYAFKITFFAGIITPGFLTEHVYRSEFIDESMFNEFVGYLTENSTFTSDVEVEFGDKIIGLQTCEYTAGKNSRYILYGIIEKQYINEEQIENNVGYQRVYRDNN